MARLKGVIGRRGQYILSGAKLSAAPLRRRNCADEAPGKATTRRLRDESRSLWRPPWPSLAEVLRGPLGLTGTKIACNRGACSACTVWLDGTPVCSCMTFAVEAGPRAVTTIEGLARGGQLHQVQEAYIDHDAMQCGFCTPGMAMAWRATRLSRGDQRRSHAGRCHGSKRQTGRPRPRRRSGSMRPLRRPSSHRPIRSEAHDERRRVG